MDKIYFRTEKLTVGYGGKPLVKDIEISLEKGKILSLIGPNGAGKSTILKSITGQLQAISGTVYIGGSSAEQIGGKELAKIMSVVLTERIRPELMTCWDVAAAGRYPYTGHLGILSKDDRVKVEEALRLVEMEQYRDEDFGNISDGQQQRIMLARAICQEPEIIILDEPTSYLDVKHKLAMLQILRRLVKQNNVTVIMSLHEIELAQKASDYILCVRGEYIHRYGTPEEIFTSEYISELYDLDNGCYSDIFGSVELKYPRWDAAALSERDIRSAGNIVPEVFVIAGGGSGAAVFRRLQREGIPFAAGVLHKNDIDYELARMLACRVISEKAYERIGEAAYEEALDVMKRCRRVICCLDAAGFGEMNERNKALWEEAGKKGMERILIDGKNEKMKENEE